MVIFLVNIIKAVCVTLAGSQHPGIGADEVVLLDVHNAIAEDAQGFPVAAGNDIDLKVILFQIRYHFHHGQVEFLPAGQVGKALRLAVHELLHPCLILSGSHACKDRGLRHGFFALHILGNLALFDGIFYHQGVVMVLLGGSIGGVIEGPFQVHHPLEVARGALSQEGAIQVKDCYAVLFRDVVLALLVSHVLHIFHQGLIGLGILIPVLEILGGFHMDSSQVRPACRLHTACYAKGKAHGHQARTNFLPGFPFHLHLKTS